MLIPYVDNITECALFKRVYHIRGEIDPGKFHALAQYTHIAYHHAAAFLFALCRKR